MAKETTPAVIDQKDDQLPSFLQGQDFSGDEDNFDSSDVVIPRIKLLQGLSTEVEAFDEAKSGIFWHTGLDVPLGDSLDFIVADRRKKYLLQAPLSDGQGILARADDAKTWDTTGKWSIKIKGVKQPVTWEITDLDVAKSGLADWGTSIPGDEDSPPAATLFYDYLVYLPQHPELGLAVMSLARSQIKSAKRGLNDKIDMHKQNGRPMQAIIFTAKVIEEHGDEGPFKNYKFQGGGFVQDEDLFNMLREYRGSLSRIKIKDEGMADEGREPGVADDGEGNF